MKKTLLALAVLGAFAGAAHAQSSVSISGNIDMGYVSKDSDALGKSAGIDNDGSSTSAIIISGTEDLGGGLKAGFFLKTNLDVGGDNGTTDLLSSQNYLSLGGNFGEFKLGKIDTQLMSAAIAASPFGTAIGSSYSGDFSRLDGIDVSGAPTGTFGAIDLDGDGTFDVTKGARPIRTSNSLYYTSPNFSGFGVTAGVSFENDEASNTAGMQEVALSYKGNGLNAILAHYRTTTGDAAVGNIPADSEIQQTLLGANYTFGPATVYGGYSQSKGKDALDDAIDSNSYNIAGKYMITPAVALMANFTKVNDDATDLDRELFGLGLDYSLSKRTTAYVRYEKADLGKDVEDAEYDKYAIGLRHAF